MILPVAPNLEFLTSRVDKARRSRSASENQASCSKCRNYACFGIVRRDISAPNATASVSKRSAPTLTGITLGGIFAACFAVLLLLVVPCYLKRRRRHPHSTPVNDMEDELYRQASCESRSIKLFLSAIWTTCLREPESAPSVSQPSPKTATLVRFSACLPQR
ncbi:hypothetical protein BJV77DRAFT_82787 [Russula vinacea]|nr:hypothetical protein BJV77DRAFT_82787 [Russula vinacea]